MKKLYHTHEGTYSEHWKLAGSKHGGLHVLKENGAHAFHAAEIRSTYALGKPNSRWIVARRGELVLPLDLTPPP